MDSSKSRCKNCGIVFKDLENELDKCAKKRSYCELCLAQKNPISETEQKIKRKYILITSITSFITMIIFFALNWKENKYENIIDYFVGIVLGYCIIWGFTSIILLPVSRIMKKSNKGIIIQEKEKYIEMIEAKKETRDNKQV